MQDRKERFLQQINAKDPRAYRELFRVFYSTLVQFSVNYVGQQDVAEDIVQEMIVSVWEKDTRYVSYNAFRSFLYHSVRNASLNHLKHKSVENRYLSSLVESEEDRDDIDSKIMKEELYRLLFETIDKLPEKCRNIFLLHLDGKGNEEIALLLDLSIFTVKTQKKRAMQFIREHLGEMYFLLLSLDMI